MGVFGGILPWTAYASAVGRAGRAEALITLRKTSGKPRLESLHELPGRPDGPRAEYFRWPLPIGLLRGAPLALKIINLPPLPRCEAKAAARYAVGDSLPFAPHDMALDAWRVGDQTLVACAPRDALTELARRNAVRGFTTVPAALAALRPPGAAGGAELFLLADDNVAGVYLLERGAPVFIRESSFGEGAPLAVEIARSLEYLRARRMAGPDTNVWIVGARAYDQETLQAMESVLNLRPHPFNPLAETVEASPALAAAIRGREAVFAPLIGAALDGGARTRLAPPRGALMRRAARRPVAAGIIAALIAHFLLWGWSRTQRWDMEQRIDAAEARLAPLADAGAKAGELATRIAQARVEIARLEGELGTMPTLHGGGIDWEAVWYELARVMPPGAALTSVSVTVNGDGARASLRGATRGDGPGDIAELRRLVEGLSKSPAFTSVSVGGAAPAGPARDRLSFEIRARINEGASSFALPAQAREEAGS